MEVATTAAEGFDLDRMKAELDAALTLDEAAALMRVSRVTLMRWLRVGLKANDGTMVRLGAMRLGKKRLVRRCDLGKFVEAMEMMISPSGPAYAKPR